MLRKTRTCILLVSIVLLGSALPMSRAVAANATAELTPVSQNIDVGQTTTVTFRVQNVEMLFGYQTTITFNPSILEVVDQDAGKPGNQVILGSFLQADFVQKNIADNGTGEITCVVSQLAPTGAVSGSGDLLTITFRGKAQGVSEVRFSDLKLAKSDGMEISTTLVDAEVSVGPTSQPTATPTLTLTPTPTATSPAQTPTPGPSPTPTITPVASPTPIATPGQTVIYVVRMGDTLYSIARRFGVTVDALAQLNSIANPRYIQVGQQLIIPREPWLTPMPPTPQPNPVVYIVQWGDTLYSIARRYGTSVEAIALQNRIANPSRIYAGQRLVISGGSAYPSPVPPYTQTHVVRAGETLYSIARRYGSTYWAIAMANHLVNPNVIYVGQRLVIP